MFWDALRAARDLGRLNEIVLILIRYGFGDLVRRLGLGHALERAGKVLHWKGAEELGHLEPPERVRRAFEEMGPTFVKLGQIMATRVDLFPPDWTAEFEKLQDQVPPMAFEKLRGQLEEDLGAAPEDVFKNIDTQAVAAGSIAQVHRATLEDGTDVVLKIRRPGIRPTVEADLRVLARFAELAEREVPELRRYHPTEVVRQFTLSMRREMDFAHECRNAERISNNLSDFSYIIIPKIYWQWTSERLNVQSFIDGIAGRNMRAVDEAGMDRKKLARRGARAVLHMIVIDGFFHADPHAGNTFYLPENHLAFLDFGMVGRLSEQRRDQVTNLLHGLLERNTAEVIEVLLDWAGEQQIVDVETLAIEIDAFLDNYHGVPLKYLSFTAMLGDLTALMRDHQLALPPDLAMLFKAFISLEGLGRMLDPEFDIVSVASPFLRRAILARYAPDAVLKRGWRSFAGLTDVLTDLPRDLRRLLKAARRGAFQMHIDLTHLDQFGQRLDKAASRITIGLVTAALIIGTAIVTTVTTGPTVFGVPLFGFIGFVGSGVGGIWLLFSIWRGGREKV